MIPSLIVALAVLVVLVGCGISAKRGLGRFEKRFPPLSDAEFTVRCAPGTDPDIAVRVRRVLAEVYDVDEERIHPSSRLARDLGGD